MARTGFYLLDRRTLGPRKWYAASTRKQGGVQHVTAGLQDLTLGDDQSAEATALYAATTDRAVSWHDGVDTGGVLRLLPAGYTAFHCKGANLTGVGQEISKKTTRWAGMPAAWVDRTLHCSAEAWRPHVEAYGWPLRVLTPAEWSKGKQGFISHAALDPARRSDPGSDFPWERLFALIAGQGGAGPADPLDGRRALRLRAPLMTGPDVEVVQEAVGATPVDGVFGAGTRAAVQAWQRAHGLAADGMVGPATWARLDEEGWWDVAGSADVVRAIEGLRDEVRATNARLDQLDDVRRNVGMLVGREDAEQRQSTDLRWVGARQDELARKIADAVLAGPRTSDGQASPADGGAA